MADEPLPLLPHEEPLPPRTDLRVAATFLAFSVAILVLAFRMPTYTDQGGQIYTAPALVPSFYGVIIGLLSLWLGVRAIRGGELPSASAPREADQSGNSNLRLFMAAGLGLLFVVGLIGHMLFWLAATVFVTLFIVAFEWRPGLEQLARARRLGAALLIGLGTGFLVTLVFERLFLVRLP